MHFLLLNCEKQGSDNWKTNMTELANAMSFEMWAGYSAKVVKQSIHTERARIICLLADLVQDLR